MTHLNLDIDELALKVEWHLSNAGASLHTQQEKYAKFGLISAATAHALAEWVTTHLQNGDARRFESYLSQAAKLLTAYWQDFGLCLIGHSGAEQPVVAQVKERRPARHIIQKPRTGGRVVSDEVRKKVEADLRVGKTDDASDNAWYGMIAQEHGISITFVRNTANRMAQKRP